MVIAAVNVPHNQLVDFVKNDPGFASLTADSVPVSSAAKAKYTSGDTRVSRPSPSEELARYCIAFEAANWHSKDLVTACVLQMLMGGGGSFSAGGPGKGMCSRLYENVLNRHGWVESASSFNMIYQDAGLFGVFGSAQATHLGSLADVFAKELHRMTGPLSETELTRAKNQLKTNVLMQLETRAMLLDDIGRQLLTYNKIQTPAETCQLIDAVTNADVIRVAGALLKKKPAVAAIGNLSFLPNYQELASHFG